MCLLDWENIRPSPHSFWCLEGHPSSDCLYGYFPGPSYTTPGIRICHCTGLLEDPKSHYYRRNHGVCVGRCKRLAEACSSISCLQSHRYLAKSEISAIRPLRYGYKILPFQMLLDEASCQADSIPLCQDQGSGSYELTGWDESFNPIEQV